MSRKFSGKCFDFYARPPDGPLKMGIRLSGEGSFTTESNRLGPRSNEANMSMRQRLEGGYAIYRGADDAGCRWIELNLDNLPVHRSSGNYSRRRNETYNCP